MRLRVIALPLILMLTLCFGLTAAARADSVLYTFTGTGQGTGTEFSYLSTSGFLSFGTVPVVGLIDAFRCSINASGQCVLRQIEDHHAVVYSALDPVYGKCAELARIPWQPTILGDWSISPDGRTVALANHDPAHPAIQLVDLSPGGRTAQASAHVREIAVPGFGTVLGTNWSSDARGFFVETSVDGRFDLLYVDLGGHATLLQQSPDLIWAQSSPDGKRIFFPAIVPVARNVWLGTLQLDGLQ